MTALVIDVGKSYAPATTHSTQGGYCTRITTIATIVVRAVPCQMIGFYVASTNTGTIQLFDSPTTNANPVSGVITPAIGNQWFPGILITGLTVVTGGTAIDVTFFTII